MVIAFSGQIKSGKTTIAQAVATAIGCPRVSFGDEVRRVVASRGLSDSRENLQAVGEELVANQLDDFCRAVLGQAGRGTPAESVVVDGLRHVEALDCLGRLLSPVPVNLVYIDTLDQLRSARYAETSTGESPLTSFENHSTEHQVGRTLRDRADLIVSGDDVSVAVSCILSQFFPS